MIIVFGQAGKQQRRDNKRRANFKHWYSPVTFTERVESKNGCKDQLFFNVTNLKFDDCLNYLLHNRDSRLLTFV